MNPERISTGSSAAEANITWVLLRGLTRESGHWGSFATQFQSFNPGTHIEMVDLPGSGQLHQQRSPESVQGMVMACRSQLASRQVKPPYHLLALSLGGMVAVAWMQDFAEEVRAALLVNISMRPFSSITQRLRPASYLPLLGLLAFRWPVRVSERAILRLTSNLADEAVLPTWVAIRQQRPVSRLNTLRQLWAAARFHAPATRPHPPVLVLTSEGDRLVSSQCSLALASAWRTVLGVHPGAGHDLPLDDGPWVAIQVRRWIQAREAAVWAA
jgi:alpha-beta hydrolase superfamily lysophospholipase